MSEQHTGGTSDEGLPMDQDRLVSLADSGQLPGVDFLCVRAEIGTGFMGMKRITKQGVVAIRDGQLVLGGEGQQIESMPVSSVESKAPGWLGGKVVYVQSGTGTRYGLGLTVGTVLAPGEQSAEKSSGALQGATDAAKRFRAVLAEAGGR